PPLTSELNKRESLNRILFRLQCVRSSNVPHQWQPESFGRVRFDTVAWLILRAAPSSSMRYAAVRRRARNHALIQTRVPRRDARLCAERLDTSLRRAL